MKVTVPIGNLIFELEVKDDKDAISQIGTLQNVFTHNTCGVCGSTDTRYVHSQNDGYNFYEIRCQAPNCWAKLRFGQKKEGGTLFPKIKDDDGNYKPHNGWERWEGRQQDQEPSANVPKGAQSGDSLPPAPAWTSLQNMLGDMGVTANEGPFRDNIIRFVTREKDKSPIGVAECVKSPEAAKRAIERLNAAIKHFGGGGELLVKVQEWMAGGKK